MMRAVRCWWGVDERGSSSVEALLLLPVMMLLATFVLWAGRAGVAALTVDLAAEEAAAAAALHCTENTLSECEQFVSDILSGHPSLDFLCVGGPRSDLRRESSTGEGVEEGVEPVGVMVVGVRFACDTDGAVAPLRGLFPLVTFHGQSTEVAVSLPAFEIDVGIEDATPVDESQDLIFKVFVESPLDVPVTLSYDITNVTPFTGGGDYSLDGPLKVTIPALAEEAYIRLSVKDDDLHEDDEQVLIELEPESFVAGRFVQLNFIENRSSASGTILDNDELDVTVSGPASPAVEGVDEFALFTVEVANAGREVAIVHQARELSNHPGPTATGGLDCAANPPPDFVTVGSELRSELIFRPDEPTTQYVEVTICNDEVSNEPQEAYAFEWHDSKYRNQFRGQLTGYIGGLSSVFLRVPDAVAAEGETISFELSLLDGVTGELKKFDFPITIGYSTAELPTTYDHLTNGFATPGAGTGCYTLSGTDYCDRDYGEVTVNGRPNPDYDNPRSTPATPGDDYEVQKERFVTFPAQSSTAVIEIPSIDDNLDEHFQRFALRLTAPTEVELPYSSQCANAMPVDSRDDCAVGVIVDNEQIPAVGIAGLSMTVEGRDFEIEVRLVDRFNPWILIPVEKGEISADVWTSNSGAIGGLECVSSGPGPDYIRHIREDTKLVFPVNVATQTLSVKICSDDRAEDVEEFSLTVEGQAGLNGLFERQFKGQITEELDVQILDASQTHVMVNSVGVASEGEPMEFRVQVWPRLERPADPAVEVDTADFPTITVDYHSVPIEPGPDPVFLAAIPGEDYEAAEGTLTFDAFTSDLTISVETIENTDYDPPRALGVVLDNLSQEARMATDRDWNLLLDDDCHLADANPSTPPRMEIVATDGPEGATHDVWVNLMDRLCDPNSSVQDWTYQIRAVPEHPTSSADLDTNLKHGAFPNFNIAFGYNGYGYKVDSSGVFLSKHFPLLITDDDIAEDDEPYYIELEWTSGPYPGYVLRSPTVYIQDDDSDAIVVSVDDVTGIEGQPLKFTVLLSNANSQTVKIGYETSESSSGRAVEGTACSGGIDFIASRSSTHGVLTFAPGEKTKTVEVQLCGDEDPDEGETFQLKLLPTDDMSGTEIIDRIAQGTILDLDCVNPSNPYHPVPTISASDVTVTEADLSARLQLQLSLPFCSKQLDALEHTVTYGTVDQDDLPAELSDGSMWVTDVDANTTEISIELDHIDDGIDDDGETYTLTFKWGAHLYPGSGAVVVEVTVKDNSDGLVATLVQNAPSAVEGQPVVFEVALNRAAVADVEVNYLVGPDSTGTEPATAGVDYTEPVSPLVIRAGARSGSIEVATVPDGVDEQNETFQLTVTTVDGGAVLNADEPSYVVGTIREPCVEPADPAAPVTITAAASPPEWLEDAGTVQYVFELGGLLCRVRAGGIHDWGAWGNGFARYRLRP